jgi:hypothetical protein
MTRFGVFFLCIVAIGIVALPTRANGNPDDGNKAKDDKESKIPLVITVNKPEGEPPFGKIQFVVEIANKTEEKIKLLTDGRTLPFTMQIFNSQGKLVNKEEDLDERDLWTTKGTRKGEEIEFAPLEKKLYPLTFNGPQLGLEAGKPVPAGDYKVIAVLPVTMYSQGSKEVNLGLPFLLKSKEIKISVPKEEK